jgi:hypothetical protein
LRLPFGARKRQKITVKIKQQQKEILNNNAISGRNLRLSIKCWKNNIEIEI